MLTQNKLIAYKNRKVTTERLAIRNACDNVKAAETLPNSQTRIPWLCLFRAAVSVSMYGMASVTQVTPQSYLYGEAQARKRQYKDKPQQRKTAKEAPNH